MIIHLFPPEKFHNTHLGEFYWIRIQYGARPKQLIVPSVHLRYTFGIITLTERRITLSQMKKHLILLKLDFLPIGKKLDFCE